MHDLWCSRVNHPQERTTRLGPRNGTGPVVLHQDLCAEAAPNQWLRSEIAWISQNGRYRSPMPKGRKMRNFAVGILFTIIVLASAGWFFLRFGYADLRANADPSGLESDLAVTAVDVSAARHAPRQQNPIASTEANLLDGARLYRDKCADCHGRPDNPVSDYGGSFYPRVPQFMKARPRLPESQNFYIIKYGVRWTAMPAWGNIMADSEVWQVVTLLSHLENLPPSVAQELHRPAGSTP